MPAIEKDKNFDNVTDYASNIKEVIIEPLQSTPADRIETIDFQQCYV